MYIAFRSPDNEPVLYITSRVKISFWIFCGSQDFAKRLEDKIGVVFEQKDKPAADKLKLLWFIPLIILGIALFWLNRG